MQWFNRSNEAPRNEVDSNQTFPVDTNVEVNDYERYIWTSFTERWRAYAMNITRWVKLETDFYRAELNNGDVIFYTSNDNGFRYMKAVEAKFDTEKMWQREFSRRLCFVMDHRDINQIILCEKSGLSQSSLSNYMNCKRIPSAYAVKVLADALDTTVEFLSHF